MTDSDVCDARKAIFERGKQANEEEKYDEAFAAITEIVAFGSELSNDEIELVNWVVNNKITKSVEKITSHFTDIPHYLR